MPLLVAVAAAAVVFHRALGYYFSQDDFQGLAQASGLAPRLVQPWRYIANQAVWDLLRPLGTVSALPHHLLSLLAHAACVALLYDLMARRLPAWAALAGATFFAVHPALFATLYWASTVGDPLALCFALLALRSLERGDRWRWLAVPLFALSLLSKESLLLLPLVAVALRLWDARRGSGAGRIAGRPVAGRARARDGVILAVGALSVAYFVYFVSLAYGAYFVPADGHARVGPGSDAPYALGWGGNLWQNLLTYLGWSVAFALPVVRRFTEGVDPGVYPWAAGALALWLAGLASPRLRARGWAIGGAVWLLFVLPVLPLRNHTYHYYLYAPLAGAALCLAAALDWALGGRPGAATGVAARDRHRVRPADRLRPGGRVAWGISGTLAALLTLNGFLLVRKIETMPFVLPGSRAEPLIDRALIARNVRESLATAALPPGTSLLFWSPTGSMLGTRGEPLPSPAPQETYWERNVRGALLDGLAVRVMFPQVVSVRFVREYAPAGGRVRYAVYVPDGRVRVATAAEVDSILRGAEADR